MISIILHLLRFVIWPTKRFMVYALWTLKKKLYMTYCCWAEYFIQILLVEIFAEFSYTLVDFLSNSSFNCWEKEIEVSSYYADLSTFPFSSLLVFDSYILQLCLVHTLIGFARPFSVDWHIYYPFCVIIFFSLKSILSDTNLATFTFLWSMFVWYINTLSFYLQTTYITF